jgi:hypothetical protein
MDDHFPAKIIKTSDHEELTPQYLFTFPAYIHMIPFVFVSSRGFLESM